MPIPRPRCITTGRECPQPVEVGARPATVLGLTEAAGVLDYSVERDQRRSIIQAEPGVFGEGDVAIDATATSSSVQALEARELAPQRGRQLAGAKPARR